MSKEKSASAGHTPTPWKVFPNDATTGYGPFDVAQQIIRSDNNYVVAAIMSDVPEVEGNAAFIVKAVNAHADLVDATIEQSLMIERAQEIITQYLVPDGYDADEAMALLIEHFDGPNQRRVKAAVRAALSRAES